MLENAKKWVTLLQNHVSLVSSCYHRVDPGALLTYLLVNHVKEACHEFFSTHSELPCGRNLAGKLKFARDIKKLIFLIFFSFLKKSAKILSRLSTALRD